MPSAFVRKLTKKRPPLLVIDLSERTSRAAVLQWDGEHLALKDYTFLEAPGLLGTLNRGQLAEHLKRIKRSINFKGKQAAFALGMFDTIARTMELPNSADTSFRSLVKLNTTKYFNQEPTDLILDCVPLAFPDSGKVVPKDAQVLTAGIRRELFRTLLAAAHDAGLDTVRITSTQVALANATRLSQPDTFDKEVFALIEFGPKTCTVTALIRGQPALSRVIELDDALNAGLDEAFATPYPVAAEIRANLIRNRLQKLLFPVGRDICAAIDYFEAQLNCRISSVLFTGGTERADLTADVLRAQIDLTHHFIDPAVSLKMELPTHKTDPREGDVPRLAGAVGAGAASFIVELVQINFLAEKIEARLQRRRDPVRRAMFAAAASILALLGWAGYTHMRLAQTSTELARIQGELKTVSQTAAGATRISQDGKKLLTTVAAMETHATNRFLAAPVLNALQQTWAENIQVVQLSIQKHVQYIPPTKPSNKNGVRIGPKKGYTLERVSVFVQAKNFGETKDSDVFMDAIASQPYFQARLKPTDPVLLKARTPRQIDPLNPSTLYTLFTVECAYPERILAYE